MKAQLPIDLEPLSVIEQVGRAVRMASTVAASSCQVEAQIKQQQQNTNNNHLNSVPLDDDNSYAKAIKSAASFKQENGFSSCEEDTDRCEATHSEGKSKPRIKARMT